jgi:hypothetical protein
VEIIAVEATYKPFTFSLLNFPFLKVEKILKIILFLNKLNIKALMMIPEVVDSGTCLLETILRGELLEALSLLTLTLCNAGKLFFCLLSFCNRKGVGKLNDTLGAAELERILETTKQRVIIWREGAIILQHPLTKD